MRKALVLWLLTVPLVSLAQASGPGPAPDPTVHRHLGFYLHLDTGVGYLREHYVQCPQFLHRDQILETGVGDGRARDRLRMARQEDRGRIAHFDTVAKGLSDAGQPG